MLFLIRLKPSWTKSDMTVSPPSVLFLFNIRGFWLNSQCVSIVQSFDGSRRTPSQSSSRRLVIVLKFLKAKYSGLYNVLFFTNIKSVDHWAGKPENRILGWIFIRHGLLYRSPCIRTPSSFSWHPRMARENFADDETRAETAQWEKVQSARTR